MALNGSFRHLKRIPVCFSSQFSGSFSSFQLLCPRAEFLPDSKKETTTKKTEIRTEVFLFQCFFILLLLGLFIVSVCVWCVCGGGGGGGYFSNPLYRDYFILLVWFWPV